MFYKQNINCQRRQRKMIFENRWSQFHKCPRMSDRKCAGDVCAAWRWYDPPEPDPIMIDHIDPLATVEPTDRPADVPKGYEFFPSSGKYDAVWAETEESAILRRRGYCGLAGKMKFAQ
jgi:hypothetical protein